MRKHIFLFLLTGWLAITPAFLVVAAETGIQDLKEIDPADPKASLAIKQAVESALAKGDYENISADLRFLLQHGFGSSPDAYFYLAYIRHRQLESWKQSKNWEGVYDRGPGLKKEIHENLSSAEKYLENRPELLLSIKFLRWQLSVEEGSDTEKGLFQDLIASAQKAPATPEALVLIRQMADDLSVMEDKAYSRGLYEVYAEKFKGTNLTGSQLKDAAEEFIRQKNIYLSKTLFEGHLEQFSSDPEALARELVFIADKYAHQGVEEALDPVYAEALYQRAFELKGAQAFTPDSQYHRAFNLERMKDFESALRQYEPVSSGDPEPVRRREALFRCGVLAAYGLNDLARALSYFERVKAVPSDTLGMSSLYQLGLLNQWKGELEKASAFYEEFMAATRDAGIDLNKDELALLCAERIREISQKQPFPYSLGLFLEGTFGAQGAVKKDFTPAGLHVDVTGRPPKTPVGENIVFEVTTSVGKTGCMVPAYAYEWSGETGGLSNIPNTPVLTTFYVSPGIKVIHAAVVGNAGLEGVGFDMVQVEGQEAGAGEIPRVKDSEVTI
ncbi:MAG: hypothetical protein WC732_00055 [Candidatus Omnitrophota bacterium]